MLRRTLTSVNAGLVLAIVGFVLLAYPPVLAPLDRPGAESHDTRAVAPGAQVAGGRQLRRVGHRS